MGRPIPSIIIVTEISDRCIPVEKSKPARRLRRLSLARGLRDCRMTYRDDERVPTTAIIIVILIIAYIAITRERERIPRKKQKRRGIRRRGVLRRVRRELFAAHIRLHILRTGDSTHSNHNDFGCYICVSKRGGSYATRNRPFNTGFRIKRR